MIQRKQSLYLLIVALIASFLIGIDPPYASFETGVGSPAIKSAKLGYVSTVLNKETTVQKWINIFVLISLCAGSLFAIFMYKKTELQKKLCIYMALLTALFIIIMAMDFNTMKAQFAGSTAYPGALSVIPVFVIILLFMAWRGIRNDEKLLKSMDRIR